MSSIDKNVTGGEIRHIGLLQDADILIIMQGFIDRKCII